MTLAVRDRVKDFHLFKPSIVFFLAVHKCALIHNTILYFYLAHFSFLPNGPADGLKHCAVS
jgi:hypothetical protein